MSTWSPTTLARIDDAYDTERASDGVSRYGSYLRQHFDLDTLSDADATDYAAEVWRVATPPITAGPPYAEIRPDLHAIRFRRSDEDGALQVVIEVPMRTGDLDPQITRNLPHLTEWSTSRGIGDDTEYLTRYEPEHLHRGALLTTTTLVLPCSDWRLITPTATSGPTLVDEARATVRFLADQLNQHAGPYIAALRREGTAR